MADDELELDYEEEKDEIKEELQEKKADPSEGSNDADKTEGRETSRQSRRDIFTSGRLSGLKSEWADESSEKQRDGYDEEESSDDSDTEKGDFFQGTASRTQETFPSFPITREGVKEDLGLTNRQLRSAIKVFGTKGIKPFEILKVFSEFGANRLNEIDQDSCLVQFQSKKLALRMMVQMSRTLTTNLRHFIQHKEDERKVADDEMDTTETKEEGEVESDDDEGEVQDHQSRNSCYKIGDDVRNTDHLTYINWRKYCVPEQKWRVVEKHVPGGRVLLVNFATSKEKSMAEKNPNQIAFPGKNVDSTGLEYSWQGEKVRPGLNIYTNDGEELDWDFQHDTRGYKKADSKDHEEEVEREWEKPALQVGIKGAVKVRGRGAKRFLGEDSETLNSDETSGQTKKPRKRNDNDDWRSAKPSQKPTRRFD